MMDDIKLYEELSINAHPAIKTHLLDGWILRFANGYTNRANSINPLYPSCMNVAEKIRICEDIYLKQGLATVYKLTPLSARLENILQQKGYRKITPTNLMIKTLIPGDRLIGKTIFTNTITLEWQNKFFELRGIIDKEKIKTAQIIQRNIQNTILCASIAHNKKIIACGLGVAERGYIGIFDIIVDKNHRGTGLGFSLCKDILNEAMRIGTKMAYLQVAADNVPAISLYKKLGFHDYYQYWYRVKNAPGTTNTGM